MALTGKQIQVHAGRKMIDQNDGIAAAHERARASAKSLNAKLVIGNGRLAISNSIFVSAYLAPGIANSALFAMLSSQRWMTLLYSREPGLPEFWISVHGVLASARSFNVFPTIAVSIGSTRPALSGVSMTP
jgi:hypothetical protein